MSMIKQVPYDYSLPSATKQAFKRECDINFIVGQYVKAGVPIKNGIPQLPDALVWPSVDVSEVPDFMSMQNSLVDAKARFASLPAKLRKRFNDDPVEFVAFCADTSNDDELVRLGLATRRVPAAKPVAAGDAGGAAPAAPKEEPKAK